MKVQTDLDSLRFMFSWKNISYDQLPSHMKDNDYIRTGYRPKIDSHMLAFSTVFRMHNETMNIWTHICGSLIYLFILLKLLIYRQEDYSFIDYVMIGSYCIINMITFSNSSIFHILNCMDEKTYVFWCKLDYVGIALLISSSIITWVYYAFYTYDVSMIIYMVSTTILGFLVACLIFYANLNTPGKRLFRSVTFGIFGLLALIPTFHYYLTDIGCTSTIPSMILIAFFYITGTFVYYLRVPERWSSKHRFDVFCSSHNIFHVFVILGSLTHYFALVKLADQRTLDYKEYKECLSLAH